MLFALDSRLQEGDANGDLFAVGNVLVAKKLDEMLLLVRDAVLEERVRGVEESGDANRVAQEDLGAHRVPKEAGVCGMA